MVSLEDMFRRFPRMPMSVEVKAVNEELINKVGRRAGVARGPGLERGLTPLHPLLLLLLAGSGPGEAL